MSIGHIPLVGDATTAREPFQPYRPDLPPEYDGHTTEEAANRLRTAPGVDQDGDSSEGS